MADSFWDIEATGCSESAGGTGLTTEEMVSPSAFRLAGWDLAQVWTTCQGSSPKLRCQLPVGDLLCPHGVDLVDFSLLAAHWLGRDCGLGEDYCDGADLDQSGFMDAADLEMMADSWLAGIAP